VRLGLTAWSLAAILNLGLIVSPAAMAQQQPAVPDAPSPQPPPKLSGADGTSITPGKGAGDEPTGPSSSSVSPTDDQPPPSNLAPSADGKDSFQTTPPVIPAPGEGFDKASFTIRLPVNFVEVPVTVKDTKGKLVAGLTWRDFRVFENNTREPLRLFTVDPAPLSVVFVVDQSLTSDVMEKVNGSLGAIQGALTPYDEIAVLTYGNGAKDRSGGFTGAQSARVPFILSMTKSSGTEELAPINDGPFDSCGVHYNGNCADPNLQRGRSAGSSFQYEPKEIHTLNDAILAAAKELSTRPRERRRIIYVISDGKEAGSKATYKQVVQYLQTNSIAVYGTAVGSSALWGVGYISRFHLPFQIQDNRLYGYTVQTGGTLDSELSLDGIEKSYAKIAEEARTQYTLGYLSHQPFIDGKFRTIDVRVERPGLEVLAKKGYWPNAQDAH
jgi:VWFA-related protein